MPIKVLSLGYEKRSVSEMIGLLRLHGTKTLIDIRELPLSRKKGFSKKSLSQYLLEGGIKYKHLRFAGNPHRKFKADTQTCLSLYHQHLKSNPQIVEEFATELIHGPVAILCYERCHDHCHRSVLLDALKSYGHEVNVVRLE